MHKSLYLKTIFSNRFIQCLTMRSVDRPPTNVKRLTIESSQEVFFVDIFRRTRSSSSAHQDDNPHNQQQTEPQPAPVHRFRRKALACRVKKSSFSSIHIFRWWFHGCSIFEAPIQISLTSPFRKNRAKKIKVPSPQVPSVKSSSKFEIDVKSNIITKTSSPKQKTPRKSQVLSIYFCLFMC
jgi:hypothetical protein